MGASGIAKEMGIGRASIYPTLGSLTGKKTGRGAQILTDLCSLNGYVEQGGIPYDRRVSHMTKPHRIVGGFSHRVNGVNDVTDNIRGYSERY